MPTRMFLPLGFLNTGQQNQAIYHCLIRYDSIGPFKIGSCAGLKVRVLHFGRFASPHIGGIEKYVETLLQQLANHIQVDNLVSNSVFRNETLRAHYNTYKVASLGTFASTSLCPAMPFLARKLHQLHQYDIINFHFPDPMSHFCDYFLPKNSKRVITWHSDIVKQKNLLKLYHPFLKNFLKKIDAVIGLSPQQYSNSSYLSKFLPAEKYYTVPYGIDCALFENPETILKAKKINEKFPGKRIIFALGRHVYYKGFNYLISAMQNIADAILIIGGSGPLTPSLKEQTKQLNLSDKVFFSGRISDEDLPAYYQACDVFCLSSCESSEAFGIVQLEAMACKKPVVSCELNNGVSFVNLHNQTGIVVPPKNPDALAKALNELLINPDKRKQLGEFAYTRVKNEFSLNTMCQKTLEVYQKIL